MRATARYVQAIVELAKREPVRTFAVLRSIGLVIVAFFPGIVTPDQSQSIVALGVVWFGVDEVVRQQTTSKAEPKIEVGTPITVTNPDPAVPDKTVIA